MEKNNLTEGSVLKSLITLSVPIIIAQFLHAAYQLTDTFWVGRLGAEAIASVSVSFPVIFLLVSLGGGLAMAGAILVAQYKGKEDQKAINHIAGQTLLSVFLASLLLSLIGYFLSPILIKLMKVEPSVFEGAVSYLQISFLGIIFMFTFFVLQSLMRGVGNVKIPMFIVLGTVLLNLALDPLFIFGWSVFPAMGVSGAALATVFTQALSALAGLLILFRKNKEISICFKKLRLDISLIKKMFFLGLPVSIERSMHSLSVIMIIFLITGFGTAATAAYGIGTRMLSLIVIPSVGLSVATATLVGQNMGAKKVNRAERIVKVSALVGFFCLTAIGMLMFLFAQQLSLFFVPGEFETVQASSIFIKLIALTFGFIGLELVAEGAFKGAGCTSISMVLSIISLWLLRFPLAFVLSKYTGLAELGIWIAFPIGNILAALIAWSWFLKGTWKKKEITKEIELFEKVSEEAIAGEIR